MSPEEYTLLAQRTASEESDNETHYALGICTEAGEIAHAVKAHIAYGQPLDRENIIEEMGDLCWYLANLMRITWTNWEEVWERNVQKLRKRYPDGFSEAAAINRADKQ